MYLRSLSISGFKSFAKKGELSFDSPITAIVGPNGSGKSNVAEAFRFVLGEQSIKSMRGKRGEDLIFNGSESTSRANRAAVTIKLNNESKVFPVDFDEILLERVVHRDGQNEYSLNGSKVRLKDVQEILAAANIGPTGHHIISQGEADRILVASPKEKREIVEDALGLKVYQYKKTEAERKLKKTKENILQVELQQKEVLPHLQYLERQMKKLEKAISLREELNEVYLEYLRREDSYIAYHADRLRDARHHPEEELRGVTEALETAKQTLGEEKENDRKRELLSLEEELSQARKERQDALRTSGQLEGQITYVRERIEKAQVRSESDADKVVPLSKVSTLVSAIEQEAEKAATKDEPQHLKRALQDIVHNLRSFVRKIREGELHSTEREEGELRELEAKKEEIDKKLSALMEKEDTLSTSYTTLKDELEHELTRNREAERTMFEFMNKKRDIEHTIERIDQELAVLDRDRDEFKRELQEAVALLGRDAAQYYEYEIKKDGVVLPREAIVHEERTVQRERKRALEKLKIRLEEVGTVDRDVEKEYKDVKERDEFLRREIADLELSVSKLEEIIDDLVEKLNLEFNEGLEKISREFDRFFILMFGGGSAKLVRVEPKLKAKNSDDEEGIESDDESRDVEDQVEGIDVVVKLPNKKVSALEMLSGGERALTSIALIFAMSQVNPPLFVILDETDAALDEANSKRYGDMIEALAEKSQLILITHNRETMSRAGVLYGVTMGSDGVSKTLSVKFDEAVEVAK